MTNRPLTIVLRLVVERQRLGPAFDTQDATRVTGVALHMSIFEASVWGQRTTKILVEVMSPMQAVQPDTSSS
jgi:hypothetical protein